MDGKKDDSVVEVTLGARTVSVPRGGLFDRFRMKTDLDVVMRDPRVPGVEFFRGLAKAQMESRVGTTMTPNFYYAMSSARVTMTAPVAAIRSRLPRELEPLQVLPGRGLVSAMFFRYDVDDIDPYLEAAVGVAVRPARHRAPGIVDLASAVLNDHLHTYVLSLPVTTEIAQVRGHDGYGFPKWVTGMDIDITERRVRASVRNDAGDVDLSMDAKTPPLRSFATGKNVSSLTSYTQIDGAWHTTFNQTNTLRSGTSNRPRLDLRLGAGRLSDDLRSLRASKPIRLDVATSAQAALHMPAPISMPSHS